MSSYLNSEIQHINYNKKKTDLIKNIIELNEYSEPIEHPKNLTITLKEHQLRIIKKCLEIEDKNICNHGIMCDKPGSGKTYAILGLIYSSQKKIILLLFHRIYLINGYKVFTNLVMEN